jgi:hypothetical protein
VGAGVTKAPFPWFGGKSKAATQIWRAIGHDAGNYVEPFFGSGAVWLGRPSGFSGWAVVNDIDGNLANFWRSVKKFPDATAEAACNPVNECDLHARHLALVNGSGKLRDRLMADPNYCEPVLAGWWAWGAAVWIGSGWCAGNGPWNFAHDEHGIPVFTKGHGGQGVNRQLPHLGDAGKGVNRKLPHLGDGGNGVCQDRILWLKNWFGELADNLREVRVACGDWERVCSPGTMTLNGPCGVVLDPPYSQTDAVYASDSSTVAHLVRAWCLANGDNKDLRIVLCGHEGEHHELEAHGWRIQEWDQKKSGGYSGKSDARERLWISPHCLQGEPENGEGVQLGLFCGDLP